MIFPNKKQYEKYSRFAAGTVVSIIIAVIILTNTSDDGFLQLISGFCQVSLIYSLSLLLY